MPPSRKNAIGKELNAKSNQLFDTFCESNLRRQIDEVRLPLTPASRRSITAASSASAADLYGDGDQSPIPATSVTPARVVKAQEPMRAAWASGLDANTCVLIDHDVSFHRACFMGDAADVIATINDARRRQIGGQQNALTHLLERRISLLRLTPLHYCCQGARSFGDDDPQPNGGRQYEAVAEALCEAGARVNARDLCGYPPLSSAAGFMTTQQSLKLTPILHKHGADPNAITRFGESILIHPIISNNPDAFRALLLMGGDVMLKDRSGCVPREMASNSPRLVQTMTEVQRILLVKKMACDACGKSGASKHCSACRKAYYCSKVCQTRDWKSGHKQQCGKDVEGHFLDIVVDTMTSKDLVPGENMPFTQYTNRITGATSSRTMRPKEYESSFVVKVSRPILYNGKVGCVKINEKNSDFLHVAKVGSGQSAHSKLREVIESRGIDVGKVYLPAKWIPPPNVSASPVTKKGNILRLDISKPLPPPKPLW